MQEAIMLRSNQLSVEIAVE